MVPSEDLIDWIESWRIVSVGWVEGLVEDLRERMQVSGRDAWLQCDNGLALGHHDPHGDDLVCPDVLEVCHAARRDQ
eukprot:14255880-Heterocapsa_arctica.AAC.1